MQYYDANYDKRLEAEGHHKLTIDKMIGLG